MGNDLGWTPRLRQPVKLLFAIMKCPKTIHLVRTYCRRVLISEYLNIAIFR